MDMGVGYSTMAGILLGSTATPLAETKWPKYSSCGLAKRHFFPLRVVSGSPEWTTHFANDHNAPSSPCYKPICHQKIRAKISEGVAEIYCSLMIGKSLVHWLAQKASPRTRSDLHGCEMPFCGYFVVGLEFGGSPI